MTWRVQRERPIRTEICAAIDPGRALFSCAISMIVRGHVRGARLLIDEPVDLPEEAEVDVVVVFDHEPDGFPPAERARLDAAITSGKEAMMRGDVVPIEHVLAEIQAARGA